MFINIKYSTSWEAGGGGGIVGNYTKGHNEMVVGILRLHAWGI